VLIGVSAYEYAKLPPIRAARYAVGPGAVRMAAREHLRLAYLDCPGQLGRLRFAAGDYRGCAGACLQLLACDPAVRTPSGYWCAATAA